MKLHLVDINPVLVAAWRKSFCAFPEVDVQCGDILSVAHNCLVSPANSHGFMDGGIDDQYRRFFGPKIEEAVQHAILLRPEGMLPVGASLAVRTGHPRIPFLIVAPTMEMPEAVSSQHCGRAMRAILRLIRAHPSLGDDVFCPGLGTLTGRVAPDLASEEMATVYSEWVKGVVENRDAQRAAPDWPDHSAYH